MRFAGKLLAEMGEMDTVKTQSHEVSFRDHVIPHRDMMKDTSLGDYLFMVCCEKPKYLCGKL